MGHDLKLPVERRPALLLLGNGNRYRVYVFVAGGQRPRDLLESPEPFLPAAQPDGRLRLFARRSVAALWLGEDASDHADLDALPAVCRAARVGLAAGDVLAGELRYHAPPDRRRTGDYLNEPSATFSLFTDDGTYQIAKHHVAFVEES